MTDLPELFAAQGRVKRWEAERENATARLQLARADEARAFLLIQHDPVASLGIDRATLRVLLNFTVHCDKARLTREIAELEGPQ